MSEGKTKVRVYKGEKINVSYDVKRCMHAAECVNSGLKSVFDNTQKPWIQPDGSSPDRIIDVIERCPSGALHYKIVGQELAGQEEIPETNSIKAQTDNALYLRGNISVQDSDGNTVIEETRLALCRCGHSKNKPFCDYSHHDAKFKDAGELGDSKLQEEFIDTEGALTVTTKDDGPLLLNGPFVLRNATNTTFNFGEKAALCRCGASANKPFCDGTHNEIGFKTSD